MTNPEIYLPTGIYQHWKRCIDCGTEKPLSEFHRNVRTPDGKHRYCKLCNGARVKAWKANHPEKVAAYVRANQEVISARERRNRMFRKFGLTPEAYETLLMVQGGGCATCGASESAGRKGHLAVDHDHVTGQVRGLLCDACNKALGFVRDDPDRLRALIDYLERSRVLV